MALFLVFPLLKTNQNNYVKYNVEASCLDISYGNENSKLTIFLFMDYTCVHCRKFLTNVFPDIKKNYIDKGDVRLNIKLLSLSNNPNILNAYKMAVCLNQHGDFSELNNLLLYETQVVFSKQYAQVCDKLIEKNSSYADCMFSGTSGNYLNENAYCFVKNEFSGTPTFVINRKIYKGFKEYEKFAEIIDKELRKLN